MTAAMLPTVKESRKRRGREGTVKEAWKVAHGEAERKGMEEKEDMSMINRD